MELPEGKEVYSTHGSSVLTSSNRSEMSNLAPCTHEEADTRLMIHALDASLRGHRRIKIRTNDTDVIVLALSVVSTLPVDEFWITYGSGKNVQHMPVHVVASSLGPSKASALPMFHALTGSDTVSFSRNRGKKSAWDVWNVFPELTPVLCALKASPEIITEESLAVLERFVVLLYDRTSSLLKVKEARQELFCKKSREFDSIPPTKAALEQHIRRAVLQGAHTWGQTLLCQPALPSPADWGWQRQARRWSPYWTTLKQAKDTCYELIHCGYKTACRGRCKCMKANLVCTGLCKCGGNCQQQ